MHFLFENLDKLYLFAFNLSKVVWYLYTAIFVPSDFKPSKQTRKFSYVNDTRRVNVAFAKKGYKTFICKMIIY